MTTKNYPVLPILAIVISLGMLGQICRLATTQLPGVAQFAAETRQGQPPAQRLTEEQVATFINTSVRPALEKFDARNQAAVNRAVARISSDLETCRASVPIFVEDITGWGARIGIIRHSVTDLWHELWENTTQTNQMRKFVTNKFEEHVFSDASLKALIVSALSQFQDDLQASRNKLHAEVRATWNDNNMVLPELDTDQIARRVTEYVQDITTNMARDSVVLGGLSLITGYVLQEAVENLALRLLISVAARVTASSAVIAAASGGATASSIVAGGSGGTALGGPGAGTATGVAVGLVVGLALDWWATGELAEKLNKECTAVIWTVEHQLLAGTHDTPGLKHILGKTIQTLREAEMEAIQTTILEETR